MDLRPAKVSAEFGPTYALLLITPLRGLHRSSAHTPVMILLLLCRGFSSTIVPLTSYLLLPPPLCTYDLSIILSSYSLVAFPFPYSSEILTTTTTLLCSYPLLSILLFPRSPSSSTLALPSTAISSSAPLPNSPRPLLPLSSSITTSVATTASTPPHCTPQLLPLPQPTLSLSLVLASSSHATISLSLIFVSRLV